MFISYKLVNHLNSNIQFKLKLIKHYSSSELINEFVIYQRSYCCLMNCTKIYRSSILFIGDSYIEQYIIALFNSKYRYKFPLVHIYISRDAKL